MEYMICGASLETVCTGEHPSDEKLQQAVNEAFRPDWQATDGYRILPRIQPDETDLSEDGTYERMPTPIEEGDVLICGGVICDSCYVTLSILSASGQGLRHELNAAISRARSMDPATLPAIR